MPGLGGALRAGAPLGPVPTGDARWLVPAPEHVPHFPSLVPLSQPAGSPRSTLPAATATCRTIGFPAKAPRPPSPTPGPVLAPCGLRSCSPGQRRLRSARISCSANSGPLPRKSLPAAPGPLLLKPLACTPRSGHGPWHGVGSAVNSRRTTEPWTDRAKQRRVPSPFGGRGHFVWGANI